MWAQSLAPPKVSCILTTLSLIIFSLRWFPVTILVFKLIQLSDSVLFRRNYPDLYRLLHSKADFSASRRQYKEPWARKPACCVPARRSQNPKNGRDFRNPVATQTDQESSQFLNTAFNFFYLELTWPKWIKYKVRVRPGWVYEHPKPPFVL